MSDADGYAISDWDRYEVNDKGGPWQEGQPVRSGPLNYLRVPTTGTFARRMANLDRLGGRNAPAAKGIYLDLCTLVAGMDRNGPNGRHGGVIRSISGRPATLDEIGVAIGRDRDLLATAVGLLTHEQIGLIHTIEDAVPSTTPGDSGACPGMPEPLAGQGPGHSGAEQSKADQDSAGQNSKVVPIKDAQSALLAAFPRNKTITKLSEECWRDMPLLRHLEGAQRVLQLVERSKQEADNPAGWIIHIAKQPWEKGGLGWIPKRNGKIRQTV
jgi:hypothetical protein